jgi:hypothetical protein
MRVWVDCVTPDDTPRHQVIDHTVAHRRDEAGNIVNVTPGEGPGLAAPRAASVRA